MSTDEKGLGRFAKHSAIYALGHALNRVGAFILLPVYTSYLSAGEYGILELFYAVAAVISGVLSAGLAHATLRFYFDYEDQPSRNAVVSTNLLAALAIGSCGAMLLSVWREDLSGLLFPGADHGRGVLLILITLVFELSSEICQAFVRAKEKSLFYVGVSIARLVVQVAANSILVIGMNGGVEGVLLGNLLAVATGWTILVAYTVRQCGLAFHLKKLLPVLRYSLPFLLTTLIGVVSANIDRFLINALLTLNALGVYALATKFSKLLLELIGEPFSRAYGAYRFTIMNRPDAAAIQARLVRYLCACAAALGLAIAMFAPDLLRLMSHRDFWPAADILPLLICASIIYLMCYPLQSGIMFRKRSDEIFYIGLAVNIIRVLGGIALISRFGILGACATELLTSLTAFILTNRVSQRFFPVRYEYRRLLGILLLAASFYFLSLLTADFSAAGSIALKMLLWCVFLVVLMRSPALDRSEAEFVVSWIRGRLGALSAGGRRT